MSLFEPLFRHLVPGPSAKDDGLPHSALILGLDNQGIGIVASLRYAKHKPHDYRYKHAHNTQTQLLNALDAKPQSNTNTDMQTSASHRTNSTPSSSLPSLALWYSHSTSTT